MISSAQKIIRLAAFSGAAAVIIGAFGAHTLKSVFDSHQLDTARLLGIYEKGVQYHFYHTLALALAGLLAYRFPENKWLPRAAGLFFVGILFFSGSLYVLACRELLPFSVAWIGPVTPLGGLCFIAGWVALVIATRNDKMTK